MRTYGGATAEQRASLRRRRLMESGLELFSTQGYARTSISAVLRHAGLKDRYFAESFASLDDLMAALMRDIYEEQISRCTEAIATDQPLRDRARNMIDVITGLPLEDPRKGRVKLTESLGAGPLTARERRLGLQRMSGLVDSLLREELHDPRIDTATLSVAVVGAVSEMLLSWFNGHLGISREELVDQGLLLFEAITEHASATSRE
ncbi:TetR/AcrR family transcriptional regulator [Streptomyces cinerochromogenes]|uniref:TetR/AcrR family transcriptional regulator n=1 Tax=Streptomyces cinerochromogenes TaxID=66422 RepID=UPI00166FD4C4|nr:TetR/AcrR family transcriptional regulator [Streptomyces cinerochromogenes]GGS89381.1 putative TetR-family transcriptional regulator [Streptomyces cinerochromogenes]